jgi:hypothetical protein
MKYNITYHAVERLLERFPHMCQYYPEIMSWTKEKGLACLKNCFNDMLSYCEENKSFINNTAYMVDLYQRYGYDCDYKLLELQKENMLFVFTKKNNEDKFILVTLMPSTYRPLVKNEKYSKNKKKESKQKDEINSWYSDVRNQDIINASRAGNLVKDLEEKLNKEELRKDLTDQLYWKLRRRVEDGRSVLLNKLTLTSGIYEVAVDSCMYQYSYDKKETGSVKIELVRKIIQTACVKNDKLKC